MFSLLYVLYLIEGSCRGFAYINLETDQAKLSKCMNVLNGCAWKGGKLQISMAKPNRFVQLEDGRVSITPRNGVADKGNERRRVKKKRKLVRLSADQTLVNDKNVDDRKGWRRGRYGRAIACLRIRRPNRQLMIIDPSHYKNNVEKLFGSIKPKPLTKLTWTITEIPEVSEISEESIANSSDHEMDIVEENDNDLEKEYECVETFNEDIQNENTCEKPSEENSFIESVSCADAKEDSLPNLSESSNVLIVDDSTIINASSHVQNDQINDSMNKDDSVVESKFEVNVNWNNLFNPDSGKDLFKSGQSSSSFTFGSLLEKSAGKVKLVPTEELFLKPLESRVDVPSEESQSNSVVPESSTNKKVHNFAGIFADLNRITATNATRFGTFSSKKEEALAEWRIERYDLKEDFKKRLSEGKRRNRKVGGSNNYNRNSGASSTDV